MATCCTEHGDSGRIRFSRDRVSGWPGSEGGRGREREKGLRELDRSENSVKARSSMQAVPHSANSGNCNREISNMRASRLHTARITASVARTASTEHIVWSSRPSLAPRKDRPREREGERELCSRLTSLPSAKLVCAGRYEDAPLIRCACKRFRAPADRDD